MPDSRLDPQELLSSLAQRGVAVDLPTLDLCFLMALHLHGQRVSLSSFSEGALVDAFERVCAAVAPVTGTHPRATHAIRRLREQRMLARVDGAGVLRAGEYALTRLATSICDFFLDDETLTRESLTLLTRSLLVSLSGVVAAARAAVAAESFQSAVVGPLRVTVADLASGIERRQRGFDLRQEHLQREIAELLKADWFGAIDRCQALLDTTSATLSELNHVLLRDAHELHAALQEIQEAAGAAQAHEAERACRAIVEQVERIAAWGAARQRAWSGYYQYVHRFLRDIVRLDPSRVVTHRVRERLAGRAGGSFALAVAAAPPCRLLREVEPPPFERPPVKRRRPEGEPALVDEPPGDPQAELDAEVRGALASGVRGLGALTLHLTRDLDVGERFVAAGRIADAAVRVAHPSGRAERPWVAVTGGLELEEWIFRAAP